MGRHDPKLAKMEAPLAIRGSRAIPSGVKVTTVTASKDAARLAPRLARRLAKKQKGSAKRRKAKLKVARLCAKTADSRRDFLHQLSTRLINENPVIAIESLSVKNMQKSRCLAKSIGDASASEWTRQLEYKARWYGHTVAQMPLNMRTWTCLECGSMHDRDINAARNVLAAGRAVSAHGEAVSPVSL